MSAGLFYTVAEVTELLRFTTTAPANPEKACRQWLHRQQIPLVPRGRTLLVYQASVEDALDRAKQTAKQRTRRRMRLAVSA